MEDSIRPKIYNANAVLLRRSASKSPVVIFSAQRATWTATKNAKTHRIALRHLSRLEVPHASAKGSFEGVREDCVIVPIDRPEYELAARFLAAMFEQESVLYLDNERGATLQEPNGATIADLGTFNAVPERIALRADAWTFLNGCYYICEQGARIDDESRSDGSRQFDGTIATVHV